ncbi:MAG: hypothetical protein DMG80_20720 [Acidobacteria bacterium]|nr:MAG: hypothetical protein DMG80_20720 [Acidobacteriota bacterium]
MLDGQLGAAFFRSDIGDFEALFLPRPKTWDELEIVEQREQGGYSRYHFRGAPTYSGTWEGKSVYFVKHRNQLLHSLDQKMVAKPYSESSNHDCPKIASLTMSAVSSAL